MSLKNKIEMLLVLIPFVTSCGQTNTKNESVRLAKAEEKAPIENQNWILFNTTYLG